MAALTDRDVNVQPTYNLAADEKQSSAGEDSKMDGPQQSKGALNHIAHNNSKPGQSYISPSDAILSPASKKLSDFKQKQIDKKGTKKPAARTLFARTTSNVSSGSDLVESEGNK